MNHGTNNKRESAVNQSEFETEPCNLRQARENMQRMPNAGKYTLVSVFGLLLISCKKKKQHFGRDCLELLHRTVAFSLVGR